MMTFDVKCSELARHFLLGYANVTPADIEELALMFQQAVEDWFVIHPDLREK